MKLAQTQFIGSNQVIGRVMTRTDFFERKLDDKRRLTIPADLRDEFGSGVVVTRGFKKYLHLYPKDVWERDVETALAGDILDETVADKNVRFRIGKIETELDGKQGRIKLEKSQLDYAGINRDVIAVRVGNYWRLMSPEAVNAL
jgi:MraZ protein